LINYTYLKKSLLLLITVCSLQIANCQLKYWQQQVNFTIDVTLNDKEHTLNGFEKIEYYNNSPDTLTFIWFHLWPNAFKNDKTAYTDQALQNGSTEFYFSSREDKGYINRLDFKVNNVTAQLEDHPQHIDIVKLVLPSPILPHQKATITTPFHVKLPYNFSRGGHVGQSYQATQWFPKPAVYDKNGWHPMPYLDQGEFYSEFGSFDVRITVPSNYVVAATGVLQNADEKEWLKSRSSFTWTPVKKAEKNAYGQLKKVKEQSPESANETKTLQYRQANIHDFAWFADKRFIVNYDTCRLASGVTIDVYTYYTEAVKKEWEKSVQYAKNAVRHYSELVGEYPFPVVQVVAGPESIGGGMEYPTITIISPMENKRTLDKVIAHEIGHNWFYGILGTNERKYPWLDEGLNSYYDASYEEKYYKRKDNLFRVLFETKAAGNSDQPITTSSEKFEQLNYGVIAYYKTAEWLRYLETQLGTEAFNKAMQEYYRRWQFRHPQPEDFKRSIAESSGRNLDSVFSLLDKKGILPNQQRKGSSLVFAVTGDLFRNGPDTKYRNQFLVAPAIGFNSYDKFMIGPMITNLRLPPNRLQFFVAPMYATGSKQLNGIGFINYSLYPEKLFRTIDIGVSASAFTADMFEGDFGIAYMRFRKIVPGFKLTFKEKDPRSSFTRFLRFKSFFVTEGNLSFYRDTVISGVDTTIATKYRVVDKNRSLAQLSLIIENNRVLYPYKGELRFEQGKDFLRTSFTGKYFFNYPKEGGLDVRLFAGKFFYTGTKTLSKQFATDRYHLNLTGANGYEDYTYSDYFIGRNRFEGFASQQIMVRDGSFKVRTDLLAEKVGKTDDWLMAVNFSTTIPSSVNPLSMLPVKIPIKLFFDIGTYAETWKQGAETDRFLFDAGLHIPLFEETINFYIPLVYSNVYRDYIQSTIDKKGRFWKKISFSIDISNFSFRKINRNLDF
jgi:hypothetical protein